jgi:hypothetical protein
MYNVEYYNCDKYDHYANECYYEKKVEKNDNFVANEDTENNDVVLLVNKENDIEKRGCVVSRHRCKQSYVRI